MNLFIGLAGLTILAIFAFLRSRKRQLRTPEFSLTALGLLCLALSQIATGFHQIASTQILGCTAFFFSCLGLTCSFLRRKARQPDLAPVIDRAKELSERLECAQAQLIESTESLKRSREAACVDEAEAEAFASLDEAILRNSIHQLRVREVTRELDQATSELLKQLEDEPE